MIKEERRRKKRIKRLLIGLAIFLLVLLIAVVIVLKVFVVKKVKVEGNVLYEEELIKDTVLNDEYSWNSLYVLLKYTFIDAEELPFIDTVEVKLNNPQSLTITVYEKGMLGYLYVPAINENAYFDKDGLVVETSSRIIENIPRIEGISCEEVVLYEKLPIENQQLKQILTLTQALKREGLEPDSIRYNVTHAPILCYDKVLVQLGSMELLTQKVEHFGKIFPSIKSLEGTLHLESWSEESVNIIFEQVISEPEPEEGSSEEDSSEEDSSEEGSSEEGGSEDGSSENGENPEGSQEPAA